MDSFWPTRSIPGILWIADDLVDGLDDFPGSPLALVFPPEDVAEFTPEFDWDGVDDFPIGIGLQGREKGPAASLVVGAEVSHAFVGALAPFVTFHGGTVGGAPGESKPELGTWKDETSSVSIQGVPRILQSDVLKILAYVVLAMLMGALLAPWLYTAGKALAEVTQGAGMSQRKETNVFIEWIASSCLKAEFPRFFNRSLMLSALLLMIPLIQWLRMERGRLTYRDTPWSLRLPEAAIATNEGQPLKRNHRGPGQLFVGFLIASSGLLLLGLALVQAEVFVWKSSMIPVAMKFPPINGWKVVRSAAGPALVVSMIEEIIFRGMLLGLFLRAMRPWAAIFSVSMLFAFVHFLQPGAGVVVPDPESPTAGLWLVGQILMRFTHPQDLIAGFATLTAVGTVLAYARWRTASLWLSVGLHAGWIFGITVFKAITWPAPGVSQATRFLIGLTLREGLVPLVVVLLTGVAVHGFTRTPSSGMPPAN